MNQGGPVMGDELMWLRLDVEGTVENCYNKPGEQC